MEKSKGQELDQETEQIEQISQKLARFYHLPRGSSIVEITHDLLDSELVDESQKEVILKSQRRIFIYEYPSSGLKIKGIVSFLPPAEKHSLIVYLRGGNAIFGIPNPGGNLLTPRNYTVVSTMYRGGVSEGKDEYGGEDLNDVKNLIAFLPVLEKALNISICRNSKYLLGASRGGLEMFLALARFPELQNFFDKIASLSGILDLKLELSQREDLLEMFYEKFGMTRENKMEWIARRDPLQIVSQIKTTLPILIVQGAKDIRVSLKSGYNMLEKLKANNHRAIYLEIAEGSHCLKNCKEKFDLIWDWLESPIC